MPDPFFTVDFLDNHHSSERRVRALETGVHPTGSDIVYVEALLPTNIPVSSGFRPWAWSSTYPAFPQWQRHNGVVTLLGGIEPASSWGAVPEESVVGVLPSPARPRTDLYVVGAMTSAPGHATLHILTDGTISVINPHPSP